MSKTLQCHLAKILIYLANALTHFPRCFKLFFGRQPIFFVFFTLLIYSYNPEAVFAVEDKGPMSIVNNDADSCINGTECQVQRYSSGAKETQAVFFGDNWEVTNPVCIALVAGYKATQIALSTAADIACTNAVDPQQITWKQGLLAGIGLSPLAFSGFFKQIKACPTNPACCVAASSFLASLFAIATANGILYGVSKEAYDNNVICGNSWLSWSNQSDNNNNKAKTCRQGAYKGSVKKQLSDCFSSGASKLCGDRAITNENYRSFIYGGIEYEDNRSSDACKNPENWSSAEKMAKLGYNSENQRYYFTGPGQTPVFACYRFYSSNKNDVDMQTAYNCCKKASQNLTCITKISTASLPDSSNDYSYSTCVAGQKCNLVGITYDVQKSTASPNRICVSSYSLCPDNHLLGGGTETKKYSGTTKEVSAQTVTNYCQYLKHCTLIPPEPYVKDISSPDSFISQACRDMKGDTQNKYQFTFKFVRGNNFSAPLVQCFKETAENIFFNRAGYSKCRDAEEESIKDVCKSGYQFKKGDPLTKDSVFVKISNSFRDIVKIMLILSVVFMGIKILLGTQPEKKLLLLYVAKIGLIIYFVLGDAWQTMFMKGVFALSETMTDITMQISESTDPKKLDGCQFPRFNYSEESDIVNPKYPPGKEYLRVWDILDCKLAKAIGFAPDVTVPNLIKIILPAIFSSFLAVGGIFFVVAVVFFGLLFFSIVIRAAQIVITSTIAIVLLVYISPLAIVAGFFDKTKEAFNSWLSQLLGMALQPMIVFAYIGVFVTVFDAVVVGKDVSFTKSGKDPVSITCGEVAKKTSIYCMFNFVEFAESINDSSGSSGSNILGLPSFWILQDVLGDSLAKSIQLFKCLLILFVFFNAFDHIPSLAVALVGGVKINAKNEIDSMGIAKKVGGGMFAAAKAGSFATGKAFKKAGDSFSEMRTPLPKKGGDDKKDSPDLKGDDALIGAGEKKPEVKPSGPEGDGPEEGGGGDVPKTPEGGGDDKEGGGDGPKTPEGGDGPKEGGGDGPKTPEGGDGPEEGGGDGPKTPEVPKDGPGGDVPKTPEVPKDGPGGDVPKTPEVPKDGPGGGVPKTPEVPKDMPGGGGNNKAPDGDREMNKDGFVEEAGIKEEDREMNKDDFVEKADIKEEDDGGEGGSGDNDSDASTVATEQDKEETPEVKPEEINQINQNTQQQKEDRPMQEQSLATKVDGGARVSDDKYFSNYYKSNNKAVRNALKDFVMDGKGKNSSSINQIQDMKKEYLAVLNDKGNSKGERAKALDSLKAVNKAVDTAFGDGGVQKSEQKFLKKETVRADMLRTSDKDLQRFAKELEE